MHDGYIRAGRNTFCQNTVVITGLEPPKPVACRVQGYKTLVIMQSDTERKSKMWMERKRKRKNRLENHWVWLTEHKARVLGANFRHLFRCLLHRRDFSRSLSPRTAGVRRIVLTIPTRAHPSVQFKIVYVRSEKPICAPPCPSEFFQRCICIENGPLSSLQGRLSSASSFCSSSVQDAAYSLEKPHTRSIPSLRRFPCVLFETVPTFVRLTIALFSSFQGKSSSASSFHASLLQAIEDVYSFPWLCTRMQRNPSR